MKENGLYIKRANAHIGFKIFNEEGNYLNIIAKSDDELNLVLESEKFYKAFSEEFGKVKEFAIVGIDVKSIKLKNFNKETGSVAISGDDMKTLSYKSSTSETFNYTIIK